RRRRLLVGSDGDGDAPRPSIERARNRVTPDATAGSREVLESIGPGLQAWHASLDLGVVGNFAIEGLAVEDPHDGRVAIAGAIAQRFVLFLQVGQLPFFGRNRFADVAMDAVGF